MGNIKKLISLFLIVFLIISVIHISYNVRLITKAPSAGWSRNLRIDNVFFNRKPLCTASKDGQILFISPYEKDEEKLNIKLFDKNLAILREEVASNEDLNFNKINSDEIYLNGDILYWRDNVDDKVYIGKISDDLKNIHIEKSFESISRMTFYADGENKFLGLINKGGKTDIYEVNDGGLELVQNIPQIDNADNLRLSYNNGVLYLQVAQKDMNSGLKNILITEFKDGEWNEPQILTQIKELKLKVMDMNIGWDKDYVYSLTTIQGGDKTRFTYIIDGYRQSDYEKFETIKLEQGFSQGIGYFSSIPSLAENGKAGFKIVTTAPTTLDIYSREISNVVNLTIDSTGIKDVQLLSKTRSWSNRPTYLKMEEEYVFWNEPGEGDYTLVNAATTEKSVVDSTVSKNFNDIKEAIGREVPVATSYTFLLSFAGRFISLAPALAWLLYIFLNNEKISNRGDKVFILGVIIYLLFQIKTINGFYTPSSIICMPEFLKNKAIKYLLPVGFTAIGYMAANIFKKDNEDIECYKIYTVFLAFAFLLMNYLYAPYMFV